MTELFLSQFAAVSRLGVNHPREKDHAENRIIKKTAFAQI